METIDSAGKPAATMNEFKFEDIFDIEEIQHLQDLFADASGVASIITNPDGTPITRPSNFCRLCKDIIRTTEKGRANCFTSDAIIGRQNPSGPVAQPCLSGGLWDAGASITVGGIHIANWLIGQVRNEELDVHQMIRYADEIGVNRDEFRKALLEVPVMPRSQFTRVSDMLFAFAKELSEKAYNILQLKKVIAEKEKATALLRESEAKYLDIYQTVSDGIAYMTLSGKILSMNNSLERILGTSWEAVVDRNVIDMAKLLLSEKAMSALIPELTKLMQGIAPPPFQLEFKDKILEISASVNEVTHRITVVVRDITERKLAEVELEESREKYRGLSEAAFESIFLSEKGKCIEQNLAGEKMFGYTTEEALVRYGTDWIVPEDREMVMNNMLRGFEEPYEATALRKDGTTFPCILNGKMMFYKGKQVRVTSLTDITERKKAAEILRESEERLRTLIEATPDTICFKDGQGRWLIANEANLSLFNMRNIDYHGKTDAELAEFIDPLYKTGFLARKLSDEETWISRKVSRREVIIYGPDETGRSFDLIKVPVFNPDGSRKGLVVLGRDITEMKRAEKVTRQLSRGIEQSPAAIVITGADGRIEYANPKFTEITQYPLNEFLGKVVRILSSEENTPEFHRQIWQTITSGKEWKGDYMSHKVGGEEYWASVSISPIVDQDGNISNFIIVIEDITDRKIMIEELMVAKEKAEQSDRLKSTFLANMSHEIRTPMNAITGFAGLLIDPETSPEDRVLFANIIQSRSDDLMRIINDILEISRIESGNATIQMNNVDLGRLLKEIEAVTARKMERLNKSHLSVTCDIPAGTSGVSFVSDSFIINQIFTNLLDNAIKFTHNGSVRYGYETPANNRITCYVTDTGIGIAPENHALIFEHFRQAEKENPHLYGGTGLGLSISKGYLALLGGEIRVVSKPGQGSTFYFTIPFNQTGTGNFQDTHRRQPDDTGKPDSHFNWGGKKILLVEDEATNMKLLKILLKHSGAELHSATSGNEVRQLYDRLEIFHLVLLDVRLPDANGWDLVKEIKALRPDLPVIAQTAYAMSGDREKSLYAGCDDHISKPIKKELLLKMISGFFD